MDGDELMRIAIAADHAGYRLKGVVAAALRDADHEVNDLGTHSQDPVDYPGLCAAAGREVATGRADRGIVIGGSGQGEAIAANKVHGVRAGLCLDEFTARLAREHNDANVLSLGPASSLTPSPSASSTSSSPLPSRVAVTSPASTSSATSSGRSAASTVTSDLPDEQPVPQCFRASPSCESGAASPFVRRGTVCNQLRQDGIARYQHPRRPL